MYKKRHPDYGTWNQMKNRCYLPTSTGYHKYGARGITVCDEWRNDFWKFVSDMGPRPTRKHSLDRIDNNGPYAPWNCRWATPAEQARNRRSNVFVTLNGVTKCLLDWANEIGISYNTLQQRKEAGWTDDEILNTPSAQKSPKAWYEWNGKLCGFTQIARDCGMSPSALRARLGRGMPLEKAVSKPLRKSPVRRTGT